ncbi:MAG: DinB family protein [Meiothermus sp.]
MQTTPQVPAFLRGNLEGCSTLASAWLRGLESTEEHVAKWASGLSKEGFWWSPAPGTNSIGGLVNHIRTTALRLSHFARGMALPPELDKPPAVQLASTGEEPEVVMARFRSAMGEVKSLIRALDPEDLEVLRERLGQRVQALHFWHKIVEHSHEHAGQIITLRKLWDAKNA